MVKNGVITVEEAEKLLSASEPVVEPQRPLEEIALKDSRGRKGKKVRIVVDAADERTKSAKVNVSIPVSLIRSLGPVIVKNMPREAQDDLNKSGIDLMQIFADIESVIDSGLDDDIVNVDTGEGADKAKVRIYVE
jgi:hypothetical protein